MTAVLLRAAKPKVLAWSALLLVATILLDRLVGRNVSLAALYALLMMLAGITGNHLAALACSPRWPTGSGGTPTFHHGKRTCGTRHCGGVAFELRRFARQPEEGEEWNMCAAPRRVIACP